MPTQTAKQQVKKINRKEQILQCLVSELEKNHSKKITTASLAKAVGVSEAALYRHFSSKATMFEALIEFCEQSVFSLIKQILTNEKSATNQCEHIVSTVLIFARRNPGICTVLTGHALVGEKEYLSERADKFFQRIETQLKQIFRQAELNKEISYTASASVYADLLLAIIEGQINEYVRTGFKSDPATNWKQQWSLIQSAL
ncbi:MAG: nucleoid occlusion factor SlmA [Pseudomonadota bacterium]